MAMCEIQEYKFPGIQFKNFNCRRAFEAAERTARKKEAQDAERGRAITEELSLARKRQTAEKERRLAEQVFTVFRLAEQVFTVFRHHAKHVNSL